MTFEIKRNVPMPETVVREKRASKYPFADMNIGDMFFVARRDGELKHTLQNRLSNVARAKFLAMGRRFIVRSITNDDGVQGVGVWRIS